MQDQFALSYCAVGLAIIAFVVFYLWPRLRRDTYRTDIRRIRDSLFDDVARNGWSFDDPAYRATRERLNSLIRMSNFLSVTLVVLGFVMIPSDESDGCTADEPPTPEGAFGQRLLKANCEAILLTFRFVFLTGFCGLMVRLVFAATKPEKAGMRAAEMTVTHAPEITMPSAVGRELTLTP